MSFSYRNLDVYKIAHRLAVEIHKMTLKELPKFEMYEQARQLRRSSKSISVNIAEGFGRRRYKSEYIRYLIYSQASCDEMNEHLCLLKDTESLSAQRSEYFLANYNELGRKLNLFIASVEHCHRTPT
jgi:four helix bundle protein